MKLLTEAITDHAFNTPDKICMRLTFEGIRTELSYRDLLEQSMGFSGRYRESGVGPGDVVLIFTNTHPSMLPAFFGAMLIGAIPSFMPCPSLKQDPDVYWNDHHALLNRTEPKLLVAAKSTVAEMERQAWLDRFDVVDLDGHMTATISSADLVVASRSDLALLQHSSGTTGLKKGVMLSYGSIASQVSMLAERMTASPDDVIVSWLPLYHDMGLVGCTLAPITLGQTIAVLDPFEWVLNPASLLAEIQAVRGAFVWLPNFAFEHLLRTTDEEESFDISSVKAFINCSEVCRSDTFDRFAAHFSIPRERLQVCYAMAETTLAVTMTRFGSEPHSMMFDAAALDQGQARLITAGSEGGRAVLSCGTCLGDTDVTIRDANGRSLPEKCVGEVVVANGSLFSGYYQLSELTRERLKDGRYWTRDLGFIYDGELFILGRVDEMLIVHGKNLMAPDVEALVSAVSGIRPGRTVAFTEYDADSGSMELCIVSERAGELSNDASLRRAIQNLIYQKTTIRPRRVRIVDGGTLIKTSSGKISRDSTKQRLSAE